MSDDLYTSARWRRLRLTVLERDGWACQIRGDRCTAEATEVDHVVPVLLAPHRSLDPENCRASCHNCNQGRVRRGRVKVTGNRPSREW